MLVEETEEVHIVVFVMYFDSLLGQSIRFGVDCFGEEEDRSTLPRHCLLLVNVESCVE